MTDLVKITTIYGETFITSLLYNSKNHIYTDDGIITKDAIKKIEYIGKEI